MATATKKPSINRAAKQLAKHFEAAARQYSGGAEQLLMIAADPDLATAVHTFCDERVAARQPAVTPPPSPLQFVGPVPRPGLPEINIDILVAKETDALRTFFGQDIDLIFYRQTLEAIGIERIQVWASLGLGVHFLPSMTLTRDMELPGWKVKPDDFYWEQLANGNLYHVVGNDLVKVEVAQLLGQVLLIDHRLKPRYRDGKQRWEDDQEYLGAIMAKLRKEQAIQGYEYGPQTSRFGVSANEVQNHVRQAAADLLGLNLDQMTLEPALVANMVPQIHGDMPRAQDGTTDTWTLYNEFFKSAAYRVLGGNSGYGGLASVYWGGATSRIFYCSFRLQGVLATQTLGT